MLPNSNKPTMQRFEARLPNEQKEILRQAADLSGRTLTDFVMNAAYEAALRVIKKHQSLMLSTKDYELFFDILMNPPEPTSALKRAAKKHTDNINKK